MVVPDIIKSTFRSATIPLTLADARAPDAPLLLVNKKFCEMTGYLEEDFSGKNCRFLQRDRENHEPRAEIRDALQNGRDTQVLVKNVTRHGDNFDNLLFIYHIRDVENKPLYFLGSQFVVTAWETASRLDGHMRALEKSVDGIIEEALHMRRGHRRQISDTLASLLRSKVLFDRLKHFSDSDLK